ncbi:MAG: hypothetical protein HYV01_00775 [Deltaproteobacteria bacterium]|nr:hypothetical protein [Deltaproteobacteria bacterium]
MIGRNNNGKEVALSTTQPVILVILDGFGINPRKEGNAIAHASMRNFAALLRNYPNAFPTKSKHERPDCRLFDVDSEIQDPLRPLEKCLSFLG